MLSADHFEHVCQRGSGAERRGRGEKEKIRRLQGPAKKASAPGLEIGQQMLLEPGQDRGFVGLQGLLIVKMAAWMGPGRAARVEHACPLVFGQRGARGFLERGDRQERDVRPVRDLAGGRSSRFAKFAADLVRLELKAEQIDCE